MYDPPFEPPVVCSLMLDAANDHQAAGSFSFLHAVECCRCCILHSLLLGSLFCFSLCIGLSFPAVCDDRLQSLVPHRIACVLDERCALHTVAHTTTDYPMYYDILGFCDLSLSNVDIVDRALSCL